MFEKSIEALEPFALTLTILAGATLTGWVNFSNKYVVGVLVVGLGILLFISHMVRRLKNDIKAN